MNNRTDKSISLVLGSGGARGLAHIGVIRVLEQQGYTIRAIAGSSMGALIGGIYAMGKLDEYERWVTSLSQRQILQLLDWNFSGGGLVKGDTLIRKLENLIGNCNIEDLDISFTAVAVDINRGREVWLDKGSLFDAIRASIAIPGVFTPHRHMGMSLVDGGLLNPVPVGPTLTTISDYTIAVDANAASNGHYRPLRENDDEHGNIAGKVKSYLGSLLPDSPTDGGPDIATIMSRSLEVMQAALTRHYFALFKPDLVISIPRNCCMIHEFHLASRLIPLGEKLAKEALQELPPVSE